MLQFSRALFSLYIIYKYIVRVNANEVSIFSTMCLVSHNDEYVDIKDQPGGVKVFRLHHSSSKTIMRVPSSKPPTPASR